MPIPERDEELKKLAKEQAKLRQKTQEMLKQLSRLRAERAGMRLSKAGGEMEQAQGELSRGRQADENQDNALDRLDEAQRSCNRRGNRWKINCRREQLGRVQETIKQIRDRQETLNREAARIQKEIQQRADWTRSTFIELTRLTENEKGLGSEDGRRGKEGIDRDAGVRQARRKSGEENGGGRRTRRGAKQEKPAFDKLPDTELADLQKDILRRWTNCSTPSNRK